MFDINAKKQRNKQKKYYEIFLSPMHGGGGGQGPFKQCLKKLHNWCGMASLSWRVVGFLGIDPIEIKVLVYLPSDDIKSQIQS